MLKILTVEDVDKIEALFQEVYDKHQGLEYWEWCFEAPYGYISVGYFDEYKLVSYYAGVLLEGNGAITYSSMTHPEYRERGIYHQLGDALYYLLSKERDWCCFYSNEKILYLHTHTKGNINAGQLKEYRIPANSEMSSDLGSILYNDRFLQWRYNNHPLEREYYSFKGNFYSCYENRIQILDYVDLDEAIANAMYLCKVWDKEIVSFWSEKDLEYPYVMLPLWKFYRALNDEVDIEEVIKNDTVRMWKHDGF